MGADHVAIFAYVESPKGFKGGPVGIPKILVQGPYVRTHKRHFLQQAWYTIAIETRSETDCYSFVPHETIGNEHRTQDVFIKITIPATDRRKALQALYEYNITRFSLFQSDEALIRTLAYKEIEAYGL